MSPAHSVTVKHTITPTTYNYGIIVSRARSSKCVAVASWKQLKRTTVRFKLEQVSHNISRRLLQDVQGYRH